MNSILDDVPDSLRQPGAVQVVQRRAHGGPGNNPAVLLPAVRGVPVLRVDPTDWWALDAVAGVVRQHNARALVREADGLAWVYVFHPAWGLANRVVREVRHVEDDAVRRGFRSPAATLTVDCAVAVPVLVPGEGGTFTELVVGDDGTGTFRTVTATAADRATSRPSVRDGPNAWKPTAGVRRASRDVRGVLAAMVDPAPDAHQRPWMLVANDAGNRVEAVLLSRAIERNPSLFLIERGIPSLHAWRACYLAGDGDSELAVRAQMDVADAHGYELLGAYSGSWNPETRFRNLCLVMVVSPDEREAIADEIHDRMAVLAREWGVPMVDRHVARPRELSRLPCTPSGKRDAEVGYAFVELLEQNRTGPALVRPVTVEEVARRLRIDAASTVPAAPVSINPLRLAPTRRPLGIDASGWVAGMSPDVRWHLEASAADLGARYKNADGSPSLSEAFWKVLSSMRAGGATVDDIIEVAQSGGGVAQYLQAQGKSVDAQRRQVAREVKHYDDKRTSHPTGRHAAPAEAGWQSLPVGMHPMQVNGVATLLDLVARVGRLDDTTGEIRVDLGARQLREAAGAMWSTLQNAAATLPWLRVDDTAVGGRDDEGERRQTTWVVDMRAVDVPEATRRVPLRAYVDGIQRTRLAHAKGILGDSSDLLVHLHGGGAMTRVEIRDRYDVKAPRVSQLLRPLLAAGLVVDHDGVLAAGSVGLLAASHALGGVERWQDVVERTLAERAADDDRVERNALPAAERRRQVAIERQRADDIRHAEQDMARFDAEQDAPEDSGVDAAMRAWADRDLQVPAQLVNAPDATIEPHVDDARAATPKAAGRPGLVVIASPLPRPFGDEDSLVDDCDGVYDPLDVADAVHPDGDEPPAWLQGIAA